MKKVTHCSWWYVIAMDMEITPELYIEWEANDIIRYIQDYRKELKLWIQDYIEVCFLWSNRDLITDRFWKKIIKECRAIINTNTHSQWKYISVGDNNIYTLFIKKICQKQNHSEPI